MKWNKRNENNKANCRLLLIIVIAVIFWISLFIALQII